MIVICFPKVCIKKVLETSCIVLDSSGKAREVANNLLVPVAPTPGSEVLVLAGEKFCMCFVVGVSTISKKKAHIWEAQELLRLWEKVEKLKSSLQRTSPKFHFRFFARSRNKTICWFEGCSEK